MTIVLLTLHVISCIILITLILIQAGRGGGLVDSFSGVESMLGTKTNAFLTRATTIFSIVFIITCLSLALLSARQSRSLLRQRTGQTGASPVTQQALPAQQPVQAVPPVQPAQEAPKGK